MFSIPYGFANEDESYITIPALRRFAKERRNDDLKTTVDRPQLIEDIENYANQSAEKEEIVRDWLDSVLVEGIKEVQIKYLDTETLPLAFLSDEAYISDILNPLLVDPNNKHLCNRYTQNLQLFRYDYEEDEHGKCIKLYMGKILCTYDKKSGAGKGAYPIFVEIYVDKGIIVARSKSKSGIYKYMEDFVLEAADTTTAEKEMRYAIKYVCGILNIQTMHASEANDKFRSKLYYMLEKSTATPQEIIDLMDGKRDEIQSLTNQIVEQICCLPASFRSDVESNVENMIEKYFSISYPDKSIFTKNRSAYPLRLNATDEEESKVEQTAALEEPLQSKAIFFDNKKMLQKSELCDSASFMFMRLNTLYCTQKFRVKIFTNKDYCALKFTEYTMEEDIKHVLFSLIDASGDIN